MLVPRSATQVFWSAGSEWRSEDTWGCDDEFRADGRLFGSSPTEDQWKSLKTLASTIDRSVAQLVREAVDDLLKKYLKK
jgi:hypothetical protein